MTRSAELGTCAPPSPPILRRTSRRDGGSAGAAVRGVWCVAKRRYGRGFPREITVPQRAGGDTDGTAEAISVFRRQSWRSEDSFLALLGDHVIHTHSTPGASTWLRAAF